MPRVILASSSPRRRDLLTLIGVAHDVRPADIDETVLPGEIPNEHAKRLAVAKALTLANSNPSALVIGSDTIVVVDGQILGKPADDADAHRMLRMLSGRAHTVITAVAVALEGQVVSDVESVTVTFRDLTNAEIDAYIATREPMDKAGSYGIQGYGATIIRKVDGDFFAVMGLSLVRLVDLMRQVGVTYSFSRGITSARS